MIRTTQDDARENEQIRLFGLTPLQGRSNKYIPDATLIVDGEINHIELKTSDLVKKQVSTARNVTLPKIEEWGKVWWVFSQYEKIEGGFRFTGEHFAAHGTDLEEWFENQREKILGGTKTYGGLRDWEQAKEWLQEHTALPAATIQKLDSSFHKKGHSLNNPKIGWRTVEKLCVKLDNDNIQEGLASLIRSRNRP